MNVVKSSLATATLLFVASFGFQARAATLPSDPCAIIPKAQVASIIGVSTNIVPIHGSRTAQCRYFGRRVAIIGVVELPSAADAKRAADFSQQTSAAHPERGMAAARGNLVASVQVMDHPGTVSSNEGLERELLNAVLASLR
jgi:hypothetical protein